MAWRGRRQKACATDGRRDTLSEPDAEKNCLSIVPNRRQRILAMKLLILSDLHAEFEAFELAPRLDYDVAILAGDIASPGRAVARWLRDARRCGNKPVIHVAGNHEYYDTDLAQEALEMRRQAELHGVHFLDCDEVVSAGVRFLGCTLWTDFRLRIDDGRVPDQPLRLLSDRNRAMTESSRYAADYQSIQIEAVAASGSRRSRLLTPMDTLRMHRRQRAWLRKKLSEPFPGCTVVITHHAPHRRSLAPRFAHEWSSGAFVSEMPMEFFKVPVLWVHGHTHDSFDYQVGPCRVLCNPRGYMNWHGEFENARFDPTLVVDIGSESCDCDFQEECL